MISLARKRWGKKIPAPITKLPHTTLEEKSEKRQVGVKDSWTQSDGRFRLIVSMIL